MSESPYIIHRDILLNGKYGTAYILQQFVLHQLEPARYPFDIEDHAGGFDDHHCKLYRDMKSWFWENGPASEGFTDIAETLRLRAHQNARKTSERLAQLRALNPEQYPAEYGEPTQDAYNAALEAAEWHHKRDSGSGYLDES